MNPNSTTPKVLLVYGCGGHKAQAFRLYEALEAGLDSNVVFTVSDDQYVPEWSSKHYNVVEVRSKTSNNYLSLFSRALSVFRDAVRVGRENNISCVISTGPGIAAIFALYMKFSQKSTIIHVETWSRFYSTSITGKVMYRFSDLFYYQNLSLNKFYPKGKYCGRL
ncbi:MULTISPECIES: PssD/Cps14F family polysaccharide biosynthesis glycosyltransferase [unclassified Halomonas]|uniref:PssD/Cps14F family polysaccharide biosynthesis glycosyltransferase n=1 Tax=Halomonas TaxID=2745 RepID=UPI001C970163|nr:hypothetical protein [Halomonas sp. DP3Y7-2]MBY6229036.1 hypothetical protein [Halomonas sp. DP3Y7-1]MCA0916981.1 hypothetical protein [Halomonas denitrificans]